MALNILTENWKITKLLKSTQQYNRDGIVNHLFRMVKVLNKGLDKGLYDECYDDLYRELNIFQTMI